MSAGQIEGTTEPDEPTTSQLRTRSIGSTHWLGVTLAFAAVYIIWGSTYLAMKVAVESLPPFLMAGTRFIIAGFAVYAFARLRGASKPQLKHWRTALIASSLLMLVGNGGVVWGQQFLPTSLAALLVTTTPLFIALLEWLIDGKRPTTMVWASLALGMAGIIYLIGPGALFAGGNNSPWFMIGIATVLLASLGWSLGCVIGRKGDIPDSPFLLAGMQMLCGGTLMLIASTIRGEPFTFSFSQVTLNSLLAMLYLVIFGSWIAYTAFTWLIQNVSATMVSTYAFVNPVVAVLLGWGFYGEQLQKETLVAGGIIIGSVALMVFSHASAKKKPKAVVVEQPLPTRNVPQLCGAGSGTCEKV